MDIILPICDSMTQIEEQVMKITLRSLEKHMIERSDRLVIVTNTPPRWYSGEFIWMHDSGTHNIRQNVEKKSLRAIEESEHDSVAIVQGGVVLLSPHRDIWVSKGIIDPDEKNRKGESRDKGDVARRTWMHLVAKGVDRPLDFRTKYPSIMKKNVAKAVYQIAERAAFSIDPKTLYRNVFSGGNIVPLDKVSRIIKTSGDISTSIFIAVEKQEMVPERDIVKKLWDRFPTKSAFEK